MTGYDDDNQKQTLKEALEQYVNSQLRGQEPDLEELVKHYPEHERQIRAKLGKLHRINNLFDSLVQADESDFEEATAEQALVGRKVGNFEITEMIGRGGMGIVYLARDTKLDRSVAIKSIPAKMAGDSTTRTRFKREAKILASLNHPNIAVIHEIIEVEKSGYLVLEYVPGETLAERMARETLMLEQTLSISQQIAEAVSAAHQKGIVHRDLKPGNIKITPEGRVKVLDFGLAKAPSTQGKKGEITETQPGRVIGTPAYMSPEQARGKETDHRTDIWSFGCIMYQMLTSHLPFEGETATDTLARIIEREPDWEALPKDTPANIHTLMRRCLEKDPDRRLGDIVEAAREIQETLSKPQTASIAKLRRIAVICSTAIIVVLFAIALRFLPEKQVQSSLKQIRLVVLPFENLGIVGDETFADVITEAITTRLASIHGLGVISRRSAMQYKDADKGAPKIAEELQVDYILEGTVQSEQQLDPNSVVRITVQLIKTSNDTHIWVQTFDIEKGNVFPIQSNVAQQVVQALDITLLEPERQALVSRPTENLEAWRFYLRGNQYFHRSDMEKDFAIAVRMYEKAVELDPKLALAHAQLSRTHSFLYWFYDRNENRLEMAKRAVYKALELDPALPEAHLALGHYYYHGHLDYDRALEEFANVRKSQINDSSDLLLLIGAVQRQLGELEEALINFKRALELDPLSSFLAQEVGTTLRILRRYPEAESYYERAISLAPDRPRVYDFKAWLYVYWEGNIEKARAVLGEALQNARAAEDPLLVDSLVLFDIYEKKYQEALEWLSLVPESGDNLEFFIPCALRRAQIYEYMNEEELANENYEEARRILKTKMQEQPNDARFHSLLGIAYAGLDYKDDAIREGELATKIYPATKTAGRVHCRRVEDLARIYVMVGKYDAAIDQLDLLLNKPGRISVPFLKLDPTWAPLRDHPRFKKLLEHSK